VFVAPYVRALKQTRPVYVAVVDTRTAHLYRYHAGEIEPLESIRAHALIEPGEHMGDAPRSGFHPGVRGPTAHDEAQRILVEGHHRLIRELTRRVLRIAGPDGWIVVGGIPRASRRAADALEKAAAGRVLHVESLDMHSTEAQIAIIAQESASTLRDTLDLDRLAALENGVGQHGLAALGPHATRAALARSCVRDLFISPRYLEEHAGDAENAVRSALDQGAAVEEVERQVAERLDQLGGIAARLRFKVGPARELATSERGV
jgi:hypothetical protein